MSQQKKDAAAEVTVAASEGTQLLGRTRMIGNWNDQLTADNYVSLFAILIIPKEVIV